MSIDHVIRWAGFYDRCRALLGGSLSQGQVDSLDLIVRTCEEYGLLRNQTAYVLATALGEVGRPLQPIREYGRGKGKEYGRRDPETGQTYYGRGFVQLTWRFNYERAGTELGVDLVNNPDILIEDASLSAKVMVLGMLAGWFTGRALDDYITLSKSDYFNARRIVNGTDRAAQFAAWARSFEAALLEGQYGVTPPARPEPTSPTSAPVLTPTPTETPAEPLSSPPPPKTVSRTRATAFAAISAVIAAVGAYAVGDDPLEAVGRSLAESGYCTPADKPDDPLPLLKPEV